MEVDLFVIEIDPVQCSQRSVAEKTALMFEDGFGTMLQERHPTMTIEVKGQKVHPDRYSLCWAPIETYQPRTAGQLATARVKREKIKAERAEKKYAEEYPLFALIERQEKVEGQGR